MERLDEVVKDLFAAGGKFKDDGGRRMKIVKEIVVPGKLVNIVVR